jgi:hypothetical protein
MGVVTFCVDVLDQNIVIAGWYTEISEMLQISKRCVIET